MIDRFNFYDIYGYVLPGLAMAIVLTVPYGIVTWKWPKADLGSTLIVIVAAYFVGQLLHGILEGAIQSKAGHDDHGNRELPSALNLSNDDIFCKEVRDRIARLVKARFDITLDVDTRLDLSRAGDEKIAELRNRVFLLCRPIANRVSSYGEQFQGLFVLSRSLSIVFALGFLFDVGWFVFSWFGKVAFAQRVLEVALIALVVLGLWRVFDKKGRYQRIDLLTLLTIGVIFATGGEVIAEYLGVAPVSWTTSALFVAATLFAFAAFRFYASYIYFANQFANAVWRNFAASGVDASNATPS